MIKVLYRNGVLVPMDPLPADLAPESELFIEIKGPVREPTPEDLDRWWRELNELAAQMDPVDSARLQAALDERHRQAKEQARAEMGSH